MTRFVILIVALQMLALLSVSDARAETSGGASLKRGTPDIESTVVINVQVQVTLLGGKVATLHIPMQRTAPAKQEAGVYDQYSGSLQLGDIPVIALQACVEGVNSVLELESIGFVVKSP